VTSLAHFQRILPAQPQRMHSARNVAAKPGIQANAEVRSVILATAWQQGHAGAGGSRRRYRSMSNGAAISIASKTSPISSNPIVFHPSPASGAPEGAFDSRYRWRFVQVPDRARRGESETLLQILGSSETFL